MHITHDDIAERGNNTCRFFVEHREVAWAALVAVVIWGIFGLISMPQRKDPDVPVLMAVATCSWPGASAQQVEQQITRKIEETIAQNKTIQPASAAKFGIRSLSLAGSSVVYFNLSERIVDTTEQFSDINLKLDALNTRLPEGAGPIQFHSGFGDTAAVMLTVASPDADDLDIQIRAQAIEEAIRKARHRPFDSSRKPVSIVYSFPITLSPTIASQMAEDFRQRAEAAGILYQTSLLRGPGFIGVDGMSAFTDENIETFLKNYIDTRLLPAEGDPDLWQPVAIRDVSTTATRLSSVAAAKYSYAQLDNYTDLIARTLLGVPQTSRVERLGVLPQQIYLEYSQERLAAYGLDPFSLGKLLNAQNVTLPGGQVQTGARSVSLDASGVFRSAASIGDVVVSNSTAGAAIYLRDLVQISRGYKTPADYLNYYTWRGQGSITHRSRAITLAIYMRSGAQIKTLGTAVDEKIARLKPLIPHDLILAKTSDQPLQVEESVNLFMTALIEAVALVVLIALIGFWEWRSALLMALSIPITLALTFGLLHLLRIELQQVSIAALIIALGLLVDDPVVATDAINRELSAGQPRSYAAWVGPTKLARAIVFATATNIIAYLPFLLLTGGIGDFLRSLPIVMTVVLLSSRIVSMTFIPLLGYVILRPKRDIGDSCRGERVNRWYAVYYHVARLSIQYRWVSVTVSVLLLVAGGIVSTRLRSEFFPEDVQYLSYVDIWLPNGSPLSLTNETATHAEQIVRRVTEEYEQKHPAREANTNLHRHLLSALTTFVGGGGPRFWFSVSPEARQSNYAQIIVQLSEKDATPQIAGSLQAAFSAEIPGAFVSVHQLQTNPVEFPIEIRIAATADVNPIDEAADVRTLRRLANEVEKMFRSIPGLEAVENDWFAESPAMRLKIDNDRASVIGIVNSDVGTSTGAALSGATVTVLREGNQQIPVVARLVPQQRSHLSDLTNLYVYASRGHQKVPLRSVSTIENILETERIRRQEHFRTISIHAYAHPGVLPSQVLSQAEQSLLAFQHNIPLGFQLIVGGEYANQREGFANLTEILVISVLGIYLLLLFQFADAIKPLLALAATPYGVAGALVALAITGTPFGFMAFLGIASLIGVIVSHVIVLFDFIEEMRERGQPLEVALCAAGVERLRPVLITVGATILAFFPLAVEGGPLWKPLCYAQIGGLAVATFVTLLLVPVFYSIAVLDLKIVRWQAKEAGKHSSLAGDGKMP